MSGLACFRRSDSGARNENIESDKDRDWGETVSSRFYLAVAIATTRYGDQVGVFLWLFL